MKCVLCTKVASNLVKHSLFEIRFKEDKLACIDERALKASHSRLLAQEHKKYAL
jgi:hypothetical protein